nr:hypothetical protein [Butyricicoccus sp. TM10-16AC]
MRNGRAHAEKRLGGHVAVCRQPDDLGRCTNEAEEQRGASPGTLTPDTRGRCTRG